MAKNERQVSASGDLGDQQDKSSSGQAEGRPRDLRGWYELGKTIHRDFPSGAERHAPTIKDTAGKLGVTRDLVYKVAVFAREYSRDELKALCDLRTAEGKPFSFSHVRRLLVVKNHSKRAMLERRAAAQGWSNEDLSAAVIHEQGERKSQGGRRPARALTPSAALRQIAVRTEQWLRRCEHSWEDAGSPLARPENLHTRDLIKLEQPLEQAGKALTMLRKKAKRLHALLEQLSSVIEGGEGDAQSIGSQSASKRTRSRRTASIMSRNGR
jgi:hypothetical protein